MVRALLVSLAGVAFALSPLAAQDDRAPTVTAVRFYRADQQQTQVRAFVQVPYGVLVSAGGTADGAMGYRVEVKVSDSTGLVLYSDQWTHLVPPAARAPGASALDMLEFAVAPGRYRLDVGVRDSISGQTMKSSLDLQGYTKDPGASDLLLAPNMRLVTGTDTVPAPSEFRRGSTLVTGAAELRLTPLRSKAYYLIEAYGVADKETSGSMRVAVKDTAGKLVTQTPATPVRIAAGGGMLKGALDLTGLPPGQYTMTVTLTQDGAEVQRTQQFSMAELQESLAREAAAREVNRETDEGYFEAMNEEALDAAFAPLVYIAKSTELRPYQKALSAQGKRRFLTEFWQGRDPSKGTAKNELREHFYDAIDYANRTYGERGAGSPAGWKSDRGRIYTKFGAPIEVFRRQQEGKAPPYEVWKMSGSRVRWFIFADRTGIGNYTMVRSNELTETGLPSWRSILTEPAVSDIGRYLGESFFQDKNYER